MLYRMALQALVFCHGRVLVGFPQLPYGPMVDRNHRHSFYTVLVLDKVRVVPPFSGSFVLLSTLPGIPPFLPSGLSSLSISFKALFWCLPYPIIEKPSLFGCAIVLPRRTFCHCLLVRWGSVAAQDVIHRQWTRGKTSWQQGNQSLCRHVSLWLEHCLHWWPKNGGNGMWVEKTCPSSSASPSRLRDMGKTTSTKRMYIYIRSQKHNRKHKASLCTESIQLSLLNSQSPLGNTFI